MPNQDTVSTLLKFGMTEREAKLYMAMLEKPETTAAELHRISGVMRTKTYETLEQMVAKGFCTERVENKRRFFHALPPSVLEEMFQKRWDHEREWKRQAAAEVFSELDKKFQLQKESDRTLDFIEVMRSKEQIHRRFLTQIQEAETEVLGFNRSPYACLEPEVLKEQEKANIEALARGVTSRTVYMMEGEHWSWLEPNLLKTRSKGEEVRITNHIPVKMFIFDKKRVMLALPAVPGQTAADFTMLIVEDPGFTEACLLIFQVFWNQAHTPEAWGEKMKASEK